MSVFHSAFGLLLRSNLAVPGLPVLGAPDQTMHAPDVELFFQSEPTESAVPKAGEDLVYVSSYTGDDGQPALRIWNIAGGTFLRMEYFDGVRFWLDREGTRVWATWNEPLRMEDVATYLLGPVLGLVLRLRGVICLHASAVALEGRAVAFVGSEGSGKSTTAAAMARRRHPVISDDIVALSESENRFLVVPAYPYLSLWSDSAEMLFGSAAALPSFSSHYEKKQLLLEDKGLEFSARPVPLGAVFLFGERIAAESAPSLESVTPQEGLLQLVADSYATHLLDPAMRAREFELLGRLLAAVPICRLHPHRDASRIDALCELIESHCRGLGTLAPAARGPK